MDHKPRNIPLAWTKHLKPGSKEKQDLEATPLTGGT